MTLTGRVSPFGHPEITARLPAPSGFSQVPTSFIASRRQVIHRMPLVARSHLPVADGSQQLRSYAALAGVTTPPGRRPGPRSPNRRSEIGPPTQLGGGPGASLRHCRHSSQYSAPAVVAACRKTSRKARADRGESFVVIRLSRWPGPPRASARLGPRRSFQRRGDPRPAPRPVKAGGLHFRLPREVLGPTVGAPARTPRGVRSGAGRAAPQGPRGRLGSPRGSPGVGGLGPLMGPRSGWASGTRRSSTSPASAEARAMRNCSLSVASAGR